MFTHKKWKNEKTQQINNRLVLGFPVILLSFYWWFCGDTGSLFSSLFSEQFNIYHHNFVSLFRLKAFRLQKAQLRVCIMSNHTYWGDLFSVAATVGLIMSPNLMSLIPLQPNYDSSFTIPTMQCWTWGCLLERTMLRCVPTSRDVIKTPLLRLIRGWLVQQ